MGLIVPDGDSDALHLKQRHIQVELFPMHSSHCAQTVCTDKLVSAIVKRGYLCISDQVGPHCVNTEKCSIRKKVEAIKKSVMCLLSNQKSILAIIYLEKNFTVILHTCRFSSGSCGSLSRSRTLSQPCLDCKLLTLIQDTLGMWL